MQTTHSSALLLLGYLMLAGASCGPTEPPDPNNTGGSTSTGGSGGSAGSSGDSGGGLTGGRATGGTTSTGGVLSTGGAQPTGGGPARLTWSWDFTQDVEGWRGGFADYPPNSGTGYDLEFGWASLPKEVGPGGGLYLNGNNHSDDLFMYVARELTGLGRDTTYLLDARVVIDSNAPSECGGIGGSPGTSVYFKIGASPLEPVCSLDSQGYLRFNLDKGNQAVGGRDLKVVGDIGTTLPCTPGNPVFEPKTLTLSSFSVTSASDGTLWVVLGTDSGFEGVTSLYYDRIEVTLQAVLR